MKNPVAILTTLFLLFFVVLPFHAVAETATTIQVAVEPYSAELLQHAAREFSNYRQQAAAISGTLGFTQEELANMELGQPFTIYMLDDQNETFPSQSFVFPVLFQNNIIGTLEGSEDGFSFGKSGIFYDQLQTAFDGTDDLPIIVGNANYVLFATNGQSSVLLSDHGAKTADPVSLKALQGVYADFLSSNQLETSAITSAIAVTSAFASLPPLKEGTPELANPLPVRGSGVYGAILCAGAVLITLVLWFRRLQ